MASKNNVMKVGLIPNDFSQDLELVFQLCEKENVKYVELASMWGKSILDLTEEELQKVKDLMKQYNLKASAIQTQIGKVYAPSSPNVKSNQSMHEDYNFNCSQLDKAIELADIFDTKYIISYGFRGRNEGNKETQEQYWKELIDTYAKFLEKLKPAGKTMCVEGDGGQLIGTVEDHLRLFEHFDSPHIQANFDLANMHHVQEFHREDFEKMHKWVPYFHCKDRKINKGWKKLISGGNRPAIFGEGTIPWRKSLQWFNEIGFDGYLSIEPHVGGKNRFEKGRKCVQNLQKMLTELGIKYE